MKQKYITPEFELTQFTSEDILVVSSATQDDFAEFNASDFE